MSKRDTYVDILFRNGLKEFEVLPPPDVWDNIKPVLIKRQKSLNIFRLAAVAAILLSISVFSNWLTKEISKDFSGPAISLNREVIPEGSYVAKNQFVTAPLIVIPVKNNEKAGPVVANEAVSSEPINLKMPSAGLFNIALKENKFQKGIKLIIPAESIKGNSISGGIGDVFLTPDNSISESTVNEVNRWSISAMGSPNYFSNMGGKGDASNNLANSEKPAVSYSGGLAVSYNLNKRISIQSGVYYSSVGQKVTGISSFAGFREYTSTKSGSEFSILTSNGLIVSSNNDIFLKDDISTRVLTIYTAEVFDPVKADLTYLNNSVIQNFDYLEVPVLFKYKAIDKKMDLNLIGGISYNMLIGNSAFTYVDGVKYLIGKTEGLNSLNLSSSFGLGFEYDFSGKISLNLEPTFKYYLTPLGGVAGSSNHPYSFGIFSGLSYKF